MSEVVCTNDLGFVASVQRSANIPLFELLCASGGRVLYSSAPTVRVGDGRCAGARHRDLSCMTFGNQDTPTAAPPDRAPAGRPQPTVLVIRPACRY